MGADGTAVVMYDTDTLPVKDASGAECLTVNDGKIRHMRIIFDRLPFRRRPPTRGGRVSGADEHRLRRAAAQRLLDALALDYLEAPVSWLCAPVP